MAYNPTTKVITAPVSVYDVQRALGTSATDVGTLCSHVSINPYAKYRPIPAAANDSRNKPTVLSDADRAALGWGIEVFWDTAAIGRLDNMMSAAAEALNNGASIGDINVKPKKYAGNNRQYYRLTDFVSGDYPTTRGYKHDARPYAGECRYNNTSTVLKMAAPILGEGGRTVNIEGSIPYALTIPNDTPYLTCWFSSDRVVVGGDELALSITELLQNADKWVSTEDHASAVVTDSLSVNSFRGLAILVRLKSDFSGDWAPFGWWQTTKGNTASVDLQAANTTNLSTIYYNEDDNGNFYSFSLGHGDRRAQWKDLQGPCCFIEYYAGSSNNMLPIPGYAYFVQVNRVSPGYDTLNIVDGSGNVLVNWQTLSVDAGADACGVEVYVKNQNGTNMTYNTLIQASNNYYSSLTARICRIDDTVIATGNIASGYESTSPLFFIMNFTALTQDTQAYVEIVGVKRSDNKTYYKRSDVFTIQV